MPARTGQQYIEGLRARPREVWLRGERVDDVTAHPTFAGPMRQLAKLYDMQHDPETRETLTYASPTTGDPVGVAFMPAVDHAGLVRRREGYRLWAEATFGLMGRSADFMNITLLAFAEGREVFARGGARFADNMVAYYEFVRENDLFLTHAIISPQTDRSKPSADQTEEFLHLGLVRETDDGIVVRGARMLATLGPLADEALIYNIPGLHARDSKHALVFAVPIDAPGLRQICREPYASGESNPFDHPLASNFEEMDTLLVFDDVLVPWDRVFVHNDVARANALFPDTNLRNYTAHQTSVRALAKMRLAVGLAIAVARAVKADGFLHVQEMLGECLNYVELVESCIIRSEYDFETTADGAVRPLYEPLQTVRTMMPRWYPRVIEVLQKIAAGGLMMAPTAADFASPIAEDVEKYYQGADGMPARERIALFKLAWDLAGDSFGGRQLQYERYYAGDPVRSTALNYLSYDTSECEASVRRALALTDPPS